MKDETQKEKEEEKKSISYILYSYNFTSISQKIHFSTEVLQWNKGLFSTDHNIQYLDIPFVLQALLRVFRDQHKEL